MLLSKEELESMAHAERECPDTVRDLGGVLFRSRIRELASRTVLSRPGDLVEIGSYHGATSVLLAEIAKQNGRRLVCVDNWMNGHYEGMETIEEIFWKTIRPFRDHVDVLRADAHCPASEAFLCSRTYCFALCDDGHTYDDVVRELRVLMPRTSGVIAVDDVYVAGVSQAFNEAPDLGLGWTKLKVEGLRESYMVRE